MPSGVTTGPYETHYEFRGSNPLGIAQNKTVTWTTQVALPKGTWLIEVFTYFAVRNLNVMVQFIAEGQRYGNGSAFHNYSGSPSFAVVTLPSLWSDVVVSSANVQEIKVFLTGGPGGGEYGSQGLTLLAWKLKPKKARVATRSKASPTKSAQRKAAKPASRQ